MAQMWQILVQFKLEAQPAALPRHFLYELLALRWLAAS